MNTYYFSLSLISTEIEKLFSYKNIFHMIKSLPIKFTRQYCYQASFYILAMTMGEAPVAAYGFLQLHTPHRPHVQKVKSHLGA